MGRRPHSLFPGPDRLSGDHILRHIDTINLSESNLSQLSRALRGVGSTSPLPAHRHHRLTGRLPARRSYSSERGEARAAEFPMLHALCALLHALCSMLHALCSMCSALCAPTCCEPVHIPQYPASYLWSGRDQIPPGPF